MNKEVAQEAFSNTVLCHSSCQRPPRACLHSHLDCGFRQRLIVALVFHTSQEPGVQTLRHPCPKDREDPPVGDSMAIRSTFWPRQRVEIHQLEALAWANVKIPVRCLQCGSLEKPDERIRRNSHRVRVRSRRSERVGPRTPKPFCAWTETTDA
jgi:hypothetical protein